MMKLKQTNKSMIKNHKKRVKKNKHWVYDNYEVGDYGPQKRTQNENSSLTNEGKLLLVLKEKRK